MSQKTPSNSIASVDNPYAKNDRAYLVIDEDSLAPDICEVANGTPGSFESLQDAKSHAMAKLRENIALGMTSLERLRFLGVALPTIMTDSAGDSDAKRRSQNSGTES